MNTIDLIIGLLVGAALGYLLRLVFQKQTSGESIPKAEFDALLSRADALESAKLKAETRFEERNHQLEDKERALRETEEHLSTARQDLARARQKIENFQIEVQQKQKETEALLEKNKADFKNLANEILKENTRSFTETNREKLEELLKPFQSRISEFRDEVQKNHKAQDERFLTFTENLKQLKELNRQISDDANSLTKALKGETKRQGNWGEMILQTILEKSGLTEGEEYLVEHSLHTEVDGRNRRVRPDVIVNLPGDRHVVIDSKVSLNAFERYVNAEDDTEAEQALKEHVLSVTGHVKGITLKNYQEARGLNSLDFILVFIPIEAAFNLALRRDTTLYDTAFEKNVVIVTPSTLLATLRVVENLWKQEKQNKNALQIAQEAGKLYDKFAAYLKDMNDLKGRLRQAQTAFDAAENKLHSGRGNLISRTEKLKALGARASKQLPAPYADSESEESTNARDPSP